MYEPISEEGEEVSRSTQEKKRRGPALTPIDQSFMFYFAIRTGTTLNVTATLFGISPRTATRYFITWLDFVARVLQLEFPVPSQAIIRQTTPESWRESLGNDRVRYVHTYVMYTFSFNTPCRQYLQNLHSLYKQIGTFLIVQLST